MNRIPVVLCGKSTQIATGAIAALKPDYEVIHLILSRSDGTTKLPLLLAGKPAESTSDLGSKNYDNPPVAVILGGGYDDEDVAHMRKACVEADAPQIPWLRPDLTKPAPPLGPDYGKAMINRVRVLMEQMKKDSKLGRGTDEVFLY